MTVHAPPAWAEAPSASVWVEDPEGTAGPLDLELLSLHEGGAVSVGSIVTPSGVGLLSLPVWAQLPRARLVAEGSAAGARGWTVKASTLQRPGIDGAWRVGLSIGRNPLGRPFTRGSMWAQIQRAGVAPITLTQAPGMRWLRLAVAAGAGPVTVQPPWPAGLITVPPGMTWAQEFSPEQAPIAPLGAGTVGTWQTVIGGAVASWSFLEGC